MILYSITINIDDEVHDNWLNWMRKTHIPEVMKTGLFKEWRMFRILSRQEDETGTTYNIQYFLENMDDYNLYNEIHAPALQQKHTDRYAGRFAAFRTLLEEV